MDAANTIYESTLRQAGNAYRSGGIDATALDAITKAGERLLVSLTVASYEQKLYLAGSQDIAAYDAAFAQLKAARTNLQLTFDKANNNG